MARLGIPPIAQYQPGVMTGAWSDTITTSKYDPNAGTLTLTIRKGVGFAARIVGIYSSATNTLCAVDVSLLDMPDALVVARINRLLQGLDAPRIETYHRTGRLVWRTKGQAIDVQRGAGFAGIDGQPYGAASAWRWNVTLPNPGNVSPAPVIAPIVAPTPQPVAPVATPTIATPEPETAPAVTPEPVVAPTPKVKVTPAQADTDAMGLFEYPQRSTTDEIITDPRDKEQLRIAWAKLESGKVSTVALVGPAGTGKTSLLDDLAADKGVGIYTVDGMGMTSFSDWVGRVDIVTDPATKQTVTRFIFSAFMQAIRKGGPYDGKRRIVRIDEVNRSESGGALNALMPILQAGRIYIPEANETVYIDRNILWAFTMNRGSAYASTVTLDAALVDRMQRWVRLDYLPEADETALVVKRTGIGQEDAARLVRTARQIREIAARGEITTGVSTRRVLEAAESVVLGSKVADAAEYCWANAYGDEGGNESERGLIVLAIKSVLGA